MKCPVAFNKAWNRQMTLQIDSLGIGSDIGFDIRGAPKRDDAIASDG